MISILTEKEWLNAYKNKIVNDSIWGSDFVIVQMDDGTFMVKKSRDNLVENDSFTSFGKDSVINTILNIQEAHRG